MKVIETWLYHVSIFIKVQEQTNKPQRDLGCSFFIDLILLSAIIDSLYTKKVSGTFVF